MWLRNTLARKDVLNESRGDLANEFFTSACYALNERPSKMSIQKTVFPVPHLKNLAKAFYRALKSHDDTEKIFTYVSTRFFDLFCELSKLRIVGDKVPDYSLVPEHITSAIPSVSIITIRRNLKDVVCSSIEFNRQKLHLFASSNSLAMAVAIILREQRLDTFLKDFPSERQFNVNQEDLSQSCLQTVKPVLNFLGVESPDKEILNYIKFLTKHPPQIRQWQDSITKETKTAVETVLSAWNSTNRDTTSRNSGNPFWELTCMIKKLTESKQRNLCAAIQQAEKIFATHNQLHTLGHCLTKLADHYHAISQYDMATPLYEAATKHIPTDPIIWYKTGYHLFTLKKTKHAQAHLLKAVEICPQKKYYNLLIAKTFFCLGKIEQISGRVSKARSFFRESLKSFPGFRVAFAALNPSLDI